MTSPKVDEHWKHRYLKASVQDFTIWFVALKIKTVGYRISGIGGNALKKICIHFSPLLFPLLIFPRIGTPPPEGSADWFSNIYWYTPEYFLIMIVLEITFQYPE
jgi:hypothetical protein